MARPITTTCRSSRATVASGRDRPSSRPTDKAARRPARLELGGSPQGGKPAPGGGAGGRLAGVAPCEGRLAAPQGCDPAGESRRTESGVGYRMVERNRVARSPSLRDWLCTRFVFGGGE